MASGSASASEQMNRFRKSGTREWIHSLESATTQAAQVSADVKAEIRYSGNIDAAKAVGKAIAEKAKSAGIDKVAFDRSGYKYHGRVQALADAARENGLQF